MFLQILILSLIFLVFFGAILYYINTLNIYYTKKINKITLINNKNYEFYKRFVNFHLDKMIKPLNSITFANNKIINSKTKKSDNDNIISYKANSMIHEIRKIIDEIKIFDKSTNGDIKLICNGFTIDNILNNAIYNNDKKDCEVSIVVDKDIREKIIKGDEIKLTQCIDIIIDNAIKHNPSNNKNVKIKIDLVKIKEDSEGSLDGDGFMETNKILVIRIKDNGMGIKKEYRDLIFKGQDELHNLTNDNIDYFGVSLYLAHNIIKYHGGTLSFTTIDNIGTTFKIELPFLYKSITKKKHEEVIEKFNSLKKSISSYEVESSDDDSDDDIEDDDKLTLNNISVLFVDDNKPYIDHMSMIMNMWGIDLDIAYNGIEAVSKVKEREEMGNQYDFIFMDNWMPEMNGIEASSEIKKINNSINIIGITGINTETDIQNYNNVGVYTVLVKPISFDKIKNILMNKNE
jgi:CheY-like chemotaxis protein